MSADGLSLKRGYELPPRVVANPESWAMEQQETLLALGCSPEYAAAHAQDIRENSVRPGQPGDPQVLAERKMRRA